MKSRKSRSPESEVPKPAQKNSAPPLLILISAPSGGGKTTLCQQLLAARPDMTRAITCTTRAPRPGEKDGVDYYFFDPAEFQAAGAGGGIHRARDGFRLELRHLAFRSCWTNCVRAGTFC